MHIRVCTCEHAIKIVAYVPGRLLQGGRSLPQDLPLQGLQRRGIILLATAILQEAARGPPTAAAAATTTAAATPAWTRDEEEVTRTDGEGGGGLDQQGLCDQGVGTEKRKNFVKNPQITIPNRQVEIFADFNK